MTGRVLSGWGFFLVILLCGMVHPGRAIELPEAPPGYSWRQVGELKAAFLVPGGWRFAPDRTANRVTFHITAPGDSDRAGLTIVAVPGPEEGEGGVVPSRLISALYNEIRKHRGFERAQAAAQGPFKTIRFQYRDPSDAPRFREYSLLVANDRTGTFYVLVFRAPLESWDEQWRTVAPVFDAIVLDDEI